MVIKKSKKQRIPRDITISDLVAYAESIGCRVEFELKPRDAEQCVHPSSGDGEEDQFRLTSKTEIVEE